MHFSEFARMAQAGDHCEVALMNAFVVNRHVLRFIDPVFSSRIRRVLQTDTLVTDFSIQGTVLVVRVNTRTQALAEALVADLLDDAANDRLWV